MSEITKSRIYLIYGILQSLLLVILGVCLILACLQIYDGGKGTFSREAVVAQFKTLTLLIPGILCLVGILAGMVFSLIFPRTPKKPKGDMHPADAIKKLFPKLDRDTCPARLVLLMKSEFAHRILLRTTAGILCVILSVPFIVHLCDPSSFDDIGAGLTQDILGMMMFVLPAAALGLGMWIVAVFGCHASYKRELSALKEAIKAAPYKGKPVSAPIKACPQKIWIVRGCVFAAAITLIVLGIFNDGMNDVLQKAIRICTECIGLG
ncbi:MAG: hypothetical protein E7645_09580 [Ruminococcaceae bacterium]|nr:hypothetical protein [Oscillospiraceae bacterium]